MAGPGRGFSLLGSLSVTSPTCLVLLALPNSCCRMHLFVIFALSLPCLCTPSHLSRFKRTYHYHYCYHDNYSLGLIPVVGLPSRASGLSVARCADKLGVGVYASAGKQADRGFGRTPVVGITPTVGSSRSCPEGQNVGNR